MKYTKKAFHKNEERRAAVLRYVLYALVCLLACLLEETWFSTGSTAPHLVPTLVADVGMFEGWRGGAWFGIFAGLLSDAAGGAAVYLLPLAYLLLGLVCGVLSKRFWKPVFWVYLLTVFLVCLLYALCEGVSVWLSTGIFSLDGLCMLYPSLFSVFCAIPIYPMVRKIHRRFSL